MPLFAFEETAPTVDPTAWIAPTATLVGDVRVEAAASVWYGAVLRADFGPIVVRAGANVQDGCVVHGGQEAVEIGPGATIGHLCVIHGCVIGAEALIGNGSTVQDGARIGDRALVAAGTLVPPNTVIEPASMFMGTAGKPRGPLTDSAAGWVHANPPIYRTLAQRHRDGIRLIAETDRP